jgi:HEAT repeat protein
VTALRLIEDPQVEPLIIDRLSKDDAVEVRTAAIEAAGKHAATSDKLTLAVEKAASSDAEVRVRIAAVRALGKWLPERPALRGALQRISEQDKDPNVLLLAKAALEANAG